MRPGSSATSPPRSKPASAAGSTTPASTSPTRSRSGAASPLADVAYESWAQSECERLKELHLVALETQLSIDLERGRHTSVAVEAERLAKEYPVRERFRELLMLALYRSGRQADALRAYQEARDVLVEELGIEPGPELRALEEKILAQDPGLGWHAPSAGGNAPVAVDEAPSATFVGRTHERGAADRPAR